MTQLVRILPSLLELFYRKNKAAYKNDNSSIRAFFFSLIAIKLCQVKDVQYNQVADALEELQTILKANYIKLEGPKMCQNNTWKDFKDVGGAQTHIKWHSDRMMYHYSGRIHYTLWLTQ